MNAIILAAGMGIRLRPLTNEIPKCLVKVNGTPMIERQIQYLHESGITDITLISGYKAEKLDYLKEKYNVSIVFNEKYDICNNIYSMYKVLDKFSDTWVIEGDVFMNKNCFDSTIDKSAYFCVYKENYKSEWGLISDDEGKLKEITIGNGSGCIMSGISYWTKTEAAYIVKQIKKLISNNDYTNLFWDNAVLDIYKNLDINIKSIDNIYEIDTEVELIEVEKKITL